MWLCYECEQDFIFFKAGKIMQQEPEGMRAEMNKKISEMITAVNKLTSDHQSNAFARNQPAAEQNVKTDKVRETVITTPKDTTKERTGPQKSDMHRPNNQTDINNEERVGVETESNAQTGQGKETEEETVQHTVTRVEEQTPKRDEGEMETQDEFKEVIYGRKQRRQRQHVMIETSRDSEIRAEKNSMDISWKNDAGHYDRSPKFPGQERS
jgi:hypothetical protein